MTGENGKYNDSKAAHLYPPFSGIPSSAKNYKIAPALTPIHKEYFKAYNRLKARKNRGSLRTDKWNQQVAMIQEWRDAAVRGKMSDAELKRRLDGV